MEPVNSVPGLWTVLLDQGFPAPPGFTPTDLDRMVEYRSLFDFDRRLSRVSTPDWMVILAAARGGLDAFVTDDQNVRTQTLELVALSATNLSLVTWSTGIEDPVTAWAQLVAYMPKIRQKVGELGPSMFVLPAVRLTRADHILKASDEAQRLASLEGRSYPEVKSEALREMTAELRRLKRADLLDVLA